MCAKSSGGQVVEPGDDRLELRVLRGVLARDEPVESVRDRAASRSKTGAVAETSGTGSRDMSEAVTCVLTRRRTR